MDAFENNLTEILNKKRKDLDSKLFERERVKKELREAATAEASTPAAQGTPCAYPAENKKI
jgi:hypothetical protein